MSNINFFRVLQNFTAASDVQEYNFFNVVASASGHFDACGSWPRYWENRQVLLTSRQHQIEQYIV